MKNAKSSHAHKASSNSSGVHKQKGGRKGQGPKTPGITPTKHRIRDIERLLRGRQGLPADVRVELERELSACQHEVAVKEAEMHQKEMIKRYHMVRFFDRQKATRRLKKLMKQFNACSDPSEQEALRREIDIAEVDLNYTIYFPLERPYSSLYPTKKGEDGKMHADETACAAGQRRDQDMWTVVQQAMREGTLEALRNTITLPLRPGRQHTNRQRLQPMKSRQRAEHLEAAASAQDYPIAHDAQEDSSEEFFEQSCGVTLPPA